MENTVIERLGCLIKQLNCNKSSFARELGVSQTSIATIFMRGQTLSTPLLEKIIRTFPQVNIEWLITGKGPMLKEKNTDILPKERKMPDNYRSVPLLNLDAVGGMESSNLETYDSQYVEEYVPFEEAKEGDVSLYVSGESMIPTCPPGCKILIRKVVDWREYFGFGNMFVLLLNDGRRILKEVVRSEEDPKAFVLCRSHNPKFSPEELPKSMIKEVWKVIQVHINRGW